LAAVECIDRPLLIVAGPGAGKTRTLTVRIAHLIRSHAVAPEAVLAITFTNKAAEEMAERLDALLGAHDARRVTVKTFHAFGARLLAEHGHHLGLPANFAIAGDDERRAILRQAVPSLSDSDASRALERIADAKNHLRNLEQIGADDGDFALFFRAYCEALAASQMVDFDDLIALAVRLLDEHPVVRQAIHARYRWISVDEYQDVNLAQVQMLRLLSAGGANLCAIGDPDQAIYGFRGADRRHFLAFQEEHPNARTILLRQSYRAPQSLLNAASQVIARSSDPDADHGARRMWSEFTEQVKLDIHRVASDKAEAETVVQRIEQMVGGTSYFSLDSGRVDETATAVRSFADFAVLYRLNTQSAALIEAFERSGMPYQAPAQTRLAEFKDVQEVLAYLWLLHNPRTRLHIEQVMTAGRVTRPPAQLIELIDAWDGDLTELFARSSRLDALSGSQRKRLEALAGFWSEFGQLVDGRSVVESIEQVHRFLVQQRGAPLSATTQERIQQLMLRAASYGQNQATFLERMTLQGETDAYDPRADRVALLTLHAAKGLEFPVVFIVGCEEGLLPYLPAGRPHDVEEERRLFYVGMTRAQHKLILTHARRRLLFGQEVYAAPSRFIDDIEHALKEIQAQGEQRLRSSKEDLQLRLFT
jgi:DNA helicase-2/ATP-dependent DNA helicase PcrA